MTSNRPDELDNLLDAALAGYANEEPRPGLEQRVLSRIQAAGAPRRLGWWRWAVAIPMFASLLLVAFLFRPKPPVIVVEQNGLSARPPVISAVVPAPPVPSAPKRAHRAANRPVVGQVPFPRRGVFPVPSPPSAEERALVDLVTRFPEQAREMLAVAEPRSIEPIEVRKIEIPPLPGGSER